MPYGGGNYRYELEDGWAKLPEGSSTFFDVPDVHVDVLDRVYITTRGEYPVMVFDLNGNLITALKEGSFGFPLGSNRSNRHGLCVGPDDSIYVTNLGQHTVSKYDLEGNLFLLLGNKDRPSDSGYVKTAGVDPSTLVKRGAPPFNGPTDVAISPTGEIYVSDGYFNASIHKFSPKGKLLLSWGEPGTGPGQFRAPHGVWVDKQGRVWICDRENNRIQIFSNEGKFIDQWTGFKQPCNLWIDRWGIVYVVELQNRITLLESNGDKILSLYAEEKDKHRVLFAPHSIAVDSKGNIYIGEVSSGSPQVVDRGIAGLQKLQKFVRKF